MSAGGRLPGSLHFELLEDASQFQDVDIGAMDVLEAVCRALDLDPAHLLTRSRARSISRARRLAAWVWSERLSRSQITMATLFGVRPSAVYQMIQRLRDIECRPFGSRLYSGVDGDVDEEG